MELPMDLRRKGLGADGISVIVPPLPIGIFADPPRTCYQIKPDLRGRPFENENGLTVLSPVPDIIFS
jgi:hypothetical protein